MNIFQIIPNILFVEDEKDVEFVEELKLNKNMEFLNINHLEELTNINHTNHKINVGDLLAISNIKSYIVKPLDTLETISNKINISKEELINKLNGEKLYIGKKIKY